MPEPLKSPRERAESFLRDAVQFRLGALVTEASHPRSTELSQVARQDADDGLAVLFDVDRDVVDTYERWSRSTPPAPHPRSSSPWPCCWCRRSC